MTDEKERAFLDELLALMQKHGITLSSCGCCGGIQLNEATEIKRQEEYYFGIYDGGHGYNDTLKIRWKGADDR